MGITVDVSRGKTLTLKDLLPDENNYEVNFDAFSEKLQNAVQYMTINEMEIETRSDLLTMLGLFNYHEIAALLELNLSKKDFENFVEFTAELIDMHLHTLIGREERVAWRENTDLIRNELGHRFNDLWPELQSVAYQKQWIYQIFSLIRIEYNNIINRHGAATIHTDEQCEEIANDFLVYAQNTTLHMQKTKGITEERVTGILNEISKRAEDLKQYLHMYWELVPLKLQYAATDDGVIFAKVNLTPSVTLDTKNNEFGISDNTELDADLYPLIIPYECIDDLLTKNGIRYADILVDENSVSHFYQFDQITNVNLTSDFLAKWFDVECPPLFKMTTNLGSQLTNEFNMRTPCLSDLLIDYTYYDCVFGDNVTADELKTIIKYAPVSFVAQHARNKMEASGYSKEELEDMEQLMSQYTSSIQAVIDKYKEDIVLEALAECNAPDLQTDKFESDFGFIRVFPLDMEFRRKNEILSYALGKPRRLQLEFPRTPSTTIQKHMFAAANKRIKAELGYSLTCDALLY